MYMLLLLFYISHLTFIFIYNNNRIVFIWQYFKKGIMEIKHCAADIISLQVRAK